MKYRIHPEAELEAGEAADWYGEEDPSLGIEFSRMYMDAVDEVLENPRRFPIAEDGLPSHECRNVIQIGRFPFVWSLQFGRSTLLS